MKTLTCSLRTGLPTAITLFFASACGGATQVHAAAPAATSMQPAEPAQGVTTVANTPTASTIHISDEILRACNIPDTDAYFAFDSSHLTAFDDAPLDALATCFEHGPMAGRKMNLVGHADPRGASEYNMTLGQSRADAVEGYLSGRGLARTAMGATSRGAMDATGKDETGWAHDRRVDVVLAD
jgi:peptidoglycan-associated lipoprotein